MPSTNFFNEGWGLFQCLSVKSFAGRRQPGPGARESESEPAEPRVQSSPSRVSVSRPGLSSVHFHPRDEIVVVIRRRRAPKRSRVFPEIFSQSRAPPELPLLLSVTCGFELLVESSKFCLRRLCFLSTVLLWRVEEGAFVVFDLMSPCVEKRYFFVK